MLFAVGGLLLAALPVTTAFFGKSLLDGAALDAHYGWLPAVFVVASALTGGAVLRVAGRVFSAGARCQAETTKQHEGRHEGEDEELGAAGRTPPLMVVVPAALLFAAHRDRTDSGRGTRASRQRPRTSTITRPTSAGS